MPSEQPSPADAAAPAAKHLLRVITCGGVGAGKSTLVARLLGEAGASHQDPLLAQRAESPREGGRDDEVDFAWLPDTCDVPFRTFDSASRRILIADTPGHAQSTRRLFAGALTANLAVVLVDAHEGLLPHIRRDSLLLAVLGIHHVVLAVNKMDRVGYEAQVFNDIAATYRELARCLDIAEVTAIPVSAAHGDNVCTPSPRMPWYLGPALLQHLDVVEVEGSRRREQPLRFLVQSITDSGAGVRGLAGTMATGTVHIGDNVRVVPSGRRGTVASIVTPGSSVPSVAAPASVTLVLTEDIPLVSGDMVCTEDAPAEAASQFQATVVWMDAQPLLRGRGYLMQIGSATATATVMPIRHRIDLQSFSPVAAERLELDEVGEVEIELDRVIAFDPYRTHRETGSFVLIDTLSHLTVGAGLLHFGLRRGDNLRWQGLDVDKAARRELNGHGSAVLWLTGLSGAGKSTIANLLEKRLHAQGVRTYVLDGDNVRHGLNKDLGFTAQDRVENIRRVAEVARLMVDAGVVVIAALISPFRAERRMARELLADGEFIEVFVDAPLSVAEGRDPKGLYAKARRGELKNFTGIDSPYDRPESPDVVLDTSRLSPEQAVDSLLRHLTRLQLLES